MRLTLSLIFTLSLILSAADKKKPVIKTSTKVEVGTQKRTAPARIGSGFSALDRNGDGAISRSEYMFNKPASENASFDRLDANKDGKLSRSEYN